MDVIFIESADSYAGKGFSSKIILKNFLTEISSGTDPITLANKYSLVRNGNGFTKLMNYSYEADVEDYKTGCIRDGKTKVKKLMECLGQINEINTTGNFYIINANSAHHFTFVLCKCAFQSQIDSVNKSAAMKRKKVVVNIDNHVDYGKYVRDNPFRNDMISCGGWGGFHMGYWTVHCVGGAEYVALSTGEISNPKEKNRVYKAGGGGSKLVKTDFLKDETAILNHLKTYLTQDHDVYLTVDRDFMLNNGTKYGDRGCQYDNTEGMKFVKKCVDALKTNCTILSADITGMPTNSDSKGPRVDKDSEGQFNLAVNDVKKFFKWVSR